MQGVLYTAGCKGIPRYARILQRPCPSAGLRQLDRTQGRGWHAPLARTQQRSTPIQLFLISQKHRPLPAKRSSTQGAQRPPFSPPPIRRARGRFPSTYWFPLAAAYGALALPWSVLAQLGHLAAPPGISSYMGHGHEMLFGFALAVVAGYTLTPNRRRHSMVLLAIWLCARVASLGWPTSLAAAALNALFTAGLVAAVAPIYLRARKWRNRSVAFVLIGLMAAVVSFHASTLLGLGRMGSTALQATVLLLSALMFFMGGRILAPAIAGHIRRKATPLRHVVQGRLEGGVLICMAAAILSVALPAPGAVVASSAGLLLAAVLTLVRIGRWRIWECRDKPDLLALLAGYAWLVIGWVLVAGAFMGGGSVTAALHAITTGALGTLSWNIMLRTQLFRSGRGTDALIWARLVVPVMALLAVLRISVPHYTPQWPLLMAAGLWFLCFGILCVLLVGVALRPYQRDA